jgi:hypothetical protein
LVREAIVSEKRIKPFCIFVTDISKPSYMRRNLYTIALLLLIALPGKSQVPTSGLVSHWPFTGNANDAGPGTNHGTVDGATLVADRLGNSESAYYFDGNDKITVPHHSSLDMAGALSISFWVKPDELHTSGNRMILGKSNYSTKTNYLVRALPHGFFQWEYQGYTENAVSPVTSTIWHHITVTASGPGTVKKIYVNGILAFEAPVSSGPFGQVTDPLTFGYAGYGSEFFKGAIDEIRIYSRELSSSEVTALYQEGACTLPDVTVTNNNPEFAANQTDASYQWINCTTLEPLSGDTGRIFTATSNGSYAVVVTLGACIDTSACYTVTALDVVATNDGADFRVFPNPTGGRLSILNNNYESGGYIIDVYSVSGLLVATKKASSSPQLTIDISDLPAGVYYLNVTYANITRRLRVVKTGDR